MTSAIDRCVTEKPIKFLLNYELVELSRKLKYPPDTENIALQPHTLIKLFVIRRE